MAAPFRLNCSPITRAPNISQSMGRIIVTAGTEFLEQSKGGPSVRHAERTRRFERLDDKVTDIIF
jgi:hypothetical protein